MTQWNLQADLFRGATWWLSDDLFVWIQDSFYESRNIDIRSNGKWISLSKAFVLLKYPDSPHNNIIVIIIYNVLLSKFIFLPFEKIG